MTRKEIEQHNKNMDMFFDNMIKTITTQKRGRKTMKRIIIATVIFMLLSVPAMAARTASSTYQHDWNDDSWTTESPTTAAETLSGTTESLTDGFDCSTYWAVQITFDINYDPDPTDSVTIRFYGSDDDTSFDDTAMDYVVGHNGTDPEQITVMIYNPPKYLRIGFQQSGSTDSHDVSTVHYIGYN